MDAGPPVGRVLSSHGKAAEGPLRQKGIARGSAVAEGRGDRGRTGERKPVSETLDAKLDVAPPPHLEI